MHIPEAQPPEDEAAAAQAPLAVRWRRARAAYRYANLASHHILGFTVKLALLVWLLFAVLFLLLRYAILPNIDYYKGDIEKLASRALGNKVSIARIYASWDGLRPNLFLGDVVLRDRQDRPALILPSVSATVSWWTVVSGQPHFESLELIRPVLDVRRAADGKLSVAGIVIEPNAGDGGNNDWLLRQREILIREGQVRWTDLPRGSPTLELADVNLLLRNRWNHHQLGLRATPPASLAKPVDIRADFTHPHFARSMADIRLWKGELYADVRDTDLAAWKAYFDYPFQLSQGHGSVRAWLTLDRMRLAGFTADLGLTGVRAVLGKDLPALDLARVGGRLSARELFAQAKAGAEDESAAVPTFGALGHQAALTDFSLETVDGLKLPATTVSETYLPAAAGKPESVILYARQVELATVSELAGQLPLTPAQRELLDDFALRGQLREFSAQWQGKYPAIASYRVKGNVAGLSMKAQPARAGQPKTAHSPAVAAMPAIPGFSNLTGSIDASDKGGSVKLASRQLVLQMPAWFTDPAMRFDTLGMQARWSYPHTDQVLFQVDAFNVTQGKLKASLSGKHLLPLTGTPAKRLGNIELDGTISGFEVSKIDSYLPMQTPIELRHWLTGALVDGAAQDVSVKLRGELAHFPFRADVPEERGRGQFRVFGRIENGKLNYAPGHFAKDGKSPLWPLAEAINGTILFDGTRMEIKSPSARTAGVALSNVKAVVADLSSHDMMLDIDGSAAGPMQEFLHYVTQSPVLEWIGHFTEDTKASANAKLALKLHLPLARLPESKVLGTLQLINNDVLLFDGLPPLQAAIGKIEFNERGVNLNGVGASFMGGPLALTGGTQRDGAILIKMAGTVSAEGVRKTWPAPALQRLTGHLSGSTRFNGAISFKDHQLQVTVDSALAGLGLDFPAPLAKPAADSMPLRFVLNGAAPTAAGVMRDEIRVSLGNAIAARYERQKLPGESWTVQRGGIGVNAPAPEPDSGMMVNVNLKTLNVDQWIGIGSAIAGPAGEAPSAAAAAAAAAAKTDGRGPDLAQYVVADTIAARAAELIIGDRKLDNVVVGSTHQKGVWQAVIDSHQVSGYVTWNESPTGQGLGKVTARLSSLIIPESAEDDVKDLLEGGKSAAATIPALDIVADRFELFNKQLGRLELSASNAQAMAGREWRINKLSLANPDGDLKAVGKWVTKDGKSSTVLNFTLDIADAGRLLDRFGFPGTLRRGKGKIAGDIAWSGLPYSLDLPSLSGQIQLNVEAGQFLKQDPGAAKLLGVLSLQALPRLLKLDFHDVFSEGLAFDGISANAIIARGVLKTENLKMHGVAATVLMDGTADIANESSNLHVVVIPEFNLGTGPLVYGLAVNPVIGLGSFLAQLFLRAPMMKALTYQLQVTGPWKAPVITRLDQNKTNPQPVKQ
ncbi:MAG: YhdP family protein [Massilia sp.]